MIDPADWTPAAEYHLEPNAMSAVTETERNVLAVAGPGAGKTELLAQRADFLLRTGVCPYPRRILAISFKTDAAQNLRKRVAERCGADMARRLDSHTFHAFAKRLIDHYRVVLTGDDALDHDYKVGEPRIARRRITFDDMVPLATEILTSSAVARNAVRNTYSHAFLDEFQDCTNVQYQFVLAAFGATPAQLTAVGDSKQRIMRFAGALDGVFERYVQDFEAEARYLYQNFRSAPRLRRLQNEMVKVMEPAAAVPEDDLLGDEGIIEVTKYASCGEEAADCADRIRSWIEDDGVAPSEIAVLVRQQVHVYAQALTLALDARGIAYRNEQALQDDFAQPAGELILDFLAVVLHARQPAAYQRLMATLTPSTGDDETDARNAARWRSGLQDARSHAQAILTADQAGEGLVEMIRSFLRSVGADLMTSLSPEYAAVDRLNEVVDSVLGRIGELADGLGGGSLADLTHVTDDGAVRILTVHKAKGLEFDTVVVLGVEHETYWGDEDDSRATFFVAVSRAKRRLVFTVAERREKPPGASRWDTTRTPHVEYLEYIKTATRT
jgi:superfamily I DNA/RNA helicase